VRIQTGEKEDSWSCSYRGCTAAAAAALLAVGRSQADLPLLIRPRAPPGYGISSRWGSWPITGVPFAEQIHACRGTFCTRSCRCLTPFDRGNRKLNAMLCVNGAKLTLSKSLGWADVFVRLMSHFHRLQIGSWQRFTGKFRAFRLDRSRVLCKRTGAIPDLLCEDRSVPAKLVTTRAATRLTGLSTAQLREWTSRRALIAADLKPKGHGSPARYSWHTLLVLRLAVSLRDRFKLELQFHQALFAELNGTFRNLSFSGLTGRVVALYGSGKWSLLDDGDIADLKGDCIVLHLDPHLNVLRTEFPPVSQYPYQTELFPALSLVEPNRRASKAPGHAKTLRGTRRETAARSR